MQLISLAAFLRDDDVVRDLLTMTAAEIGAVLGAPTGWHCSGSAPFPDLWFYDGCEVALQAAPPHRVMYIKLRPDEFEGDAQLLNSDRSQALGLTLDGFDRTSRPSHYLRAIQAAGGVAEVVFRNLTDTVDFWITANDTLCIAFSADGEDLGLAADAGRVVVDPKDASLLRRLDAVAEPESLYLRAEEPEEVASEEPAVSQAARQTRIAGANYLAVIEGASAP